MIAAAWIFEDYQMAAFIYFAEYEFANDEVMRSARKESIA